MRTGTMSIEGDLGSSEGPVQQGVETPQKQVGKVPIPVFDLFPDLQHGTRVLPPVRKAPSLGEPFHAAQAEAEATQHGGLGDESPTDTGIRLGEQAVEEHIASQPTFLTQAAEQIRHPSPSSHKLSDTFILKGALAIRTRMNPDHQERAEKVADFLRKVDTIVQITKNIITGGP